MLNVDSGTVINYINNMNGKLKEAKTAPLQFDKFINKTLHHLFNIEKPKYPQVIKIPKSIPELLEGDFQPAKEIIVNAPIRLEDGTPIWFGDSTSGVDLLFGYKNGDSRYISDLALDDKDIHLVLVGGTGSGKSVTINTTIFGMAMKYAPWSLKLVMSDAKIVEFKRYAMVDKLPHITSIAATSDTDYTISLLESVFNEMVLMNQVYGKAGQQNIQGFKKATGLEIPQTIIFIEEFQYMFTKAGKKEGRIKEILDGFARLGRSAGYHLVFASQGLGSSFPKDTLNNINIRGALACKKNVSEIVLGNDEAGSLTQKGRLIINTNPDGGSKEDNTTYRVPFQSESLFLQQSTQLNKAGVKYDFIRPLDFYDEQSVYRYDGFKKLLAGFPTDKNVLYLGEPSFVIPDEDKILKIKMTREDIENILVYCKDITSLSRYALMFKANMEKLKGVVNNMIINVDNYFEREYSLSDIATKTPTGAPFSLNIKNVQDGAYRSVLQNVYRRKLIYEVDLLAFESDLSEDELNSLDEVFYQIIPKGGDFDTPLNKKRCYYAWHKLTSEEFMKPLGISLASKDIELSSKLPVVKSTVIWYIENNLRNTRVTLDKFPPMYIWILGLNKLLGLGRDSRSSNVEELKKVLLDSCEYNIRFIMFTNTMEDMYPLRVGFRYFILDGLSSQDASRIKCDDYPEERAPILGVMFDSMNTITPIYKFKKMLLDGETIT